jgi:hypothetical protein
LESYFYLAGFGIVAAAIVLTGKAIVEELINFKTTMADLLED